MNRKIISIICAVSCIIITISIAVVLHNNDDNKMSSGNLNNELLQETTQENQEEIRIGETENLTEPSTENSKENLLKNSKEKLKEKLNIVSGYLESVQSDKNINDFVEWFSSCYNINIVSELAYNSSNDINRDFYLQTGKSLFVLCDEFIGNTDVKEIAAADSKEFNMLFAGDICLAEDGFVLDYYDTTSGLNDCISKEILDITNAADLFMVNNEFCLSDRGEPLPGKMYTFRAAPYRVDILKQFGVDVVSLANNHVYDFGPDAFWDTMLHLEEAGIEKVGGGNNNTEAESVLYYHVNGIKIGIIAASSAEKSRYTPGATESLSGIFLMYNTERLLEVSKNADKQCDFLITYLHWGTEDSDRYEQYQHDLAVMLKDCGVDAIIGGHPHKLQGVEYIENVPVIYSLGDYWFNSETKYTGMINMKIGIDGIQEMSFIPCIQKEYKCLYISDEEMKRDIFSYMNARSTYCQFDETGKAINNFYD